MGGSVSRNRRHPALVVMSDDGPVFFSSAAAATGYIETVDVEDGVWGPAFMLDGRVVSVRPARIDSAQLPRARWRRALRLPARHDGHVVEVLAEVPPRPEELRTMLVEALSAEHKSDELPVESLIGAAVAHYGVTW